MVILPASEGGAIAAAMFEQQDSASRPAYPPHLAQCLYRVEECAGSKRRDDSVERAVLEREVFGVHYDDLAGAPIACPQEHARAEIDGCDIKVPWVVTEIQSGTGGNFENPARG
jgi:hypothetical protein